jgi:ribosomal protein S26
MLPKLENSKQKGRRKVMDCKNCGHPIIWLCTLTNIFLHVNLGIATIRCQKCGCHKAVPKTKTNSKMTRKEAQLIGNRAMSNCPYIPCKDYPNCVHYKKFKSQFQSKKLDGEK